MRFEIQLTDRFITHLEEISDYIARSSPRNALQWIENVERQLLKLETFPERHPPARETDAHDLPLRQMLYGKGRCRYRIIFSIDGSMVTVLDIRHSSREDFESGPLDENS